MRGGAALTRPTNCIIPVGLIRRSRHQAEPRYCARFWLRTELFAGWRCAYPAYKLHHSRRPDKAQPPSGRTTILRPVLAPDSFFAGWRCAYPAYKLHHSRRPDKAQPPSGRTTILRPVLAPDSFFAGWRCAYPAYKLHHSRRPDKAQPPSGRTSLEQVVM
ncbi:hypothetical protein EDP2_2207 [Enterobacter cloacae S611]|uniref:Uncharacterized protein n=1 Tax=Enterobacter cloacae S611 TaxID=1399146 RepID=A0ABN0QC73_ENTCL|nr:hypothetical protein EDP2_2207 [Enterobacter cloacae S611]